MLEMFGGCKERPYDIFQVMREAAEECKTAEQADRQRIRNRGLHRPSGKMSGPGSTSKTWPCGRAVAVTHVFCGDKLRL